MRRLASFLALASLALSARGAPATGRVYAAVGETAGAGAAAAAPSRLADRLERAGTRLRLVDLTLPSMTAEQLRRDQLPRVVALRPALVTVSVGATDVCAATPLLQFSRDLHVIADLLRRNVPSVVLSTVTLPEGACARSGPALQRRLESFNWAITRTAERNGAALADVSGAGGARRSWEEAVAGQLGLRAPPTPRGATPPPAPAPEDVPPSI